MRKSASHFILLCVLWARHSSSLGTVQLFAQSYLLLKTPGKKQQKHDELPKSAPLLSNGYGYG